MSYRYTNKIGAFKLLHLPSELAGFFSFKNKIKKQNLNIPHAFTWKYLPSALKSFSTKNIQQIHMI